MINDIIFKEKYNLYANDLYIISYGYLHNKYDAEDIVQDVFLKYLANKRVFTDLDHEKYWLIRVTINLCKDFLKKKKRVNIDVEYVKNIANSNDENQILKYEINKLPDIYKDVIVLYYYKNYPTKDIANMLKTSDSNVIKRLERARQILKERMIDYENRW